MRRISWLFLFVGVALLIGYKIAMPWTPLWIDGLLLGLGALSFLVAYLIGSKHRKSKGPGLD